MSTLARAAEAAPRTAGGQQRGLRFAAERAAEVGEGMRDAATWIRSYVLEGHDGSVGTLCIYQASSQR